MDSEGRQTEIRCHIWLGELKEGELKIIKEIRLGRVNIIRYKKIM
jgi:hypothetical protein